MNHRTLLRRQLRRARQSIPPRQRRLAAQALKRRLLKLKEIRRADSLACYAALGSELSLNPFMHAASRQGKQIYLPRMLGARMHFHDSRRPRRSNRLGIQEPAPGRSRPPWAMDVILLPLVGADPLGNRLGQGGGYYDRWLSRLRFRRPCLLGIAYDCQIVEQIPAEPWDIPLDGLITPTQSLFFRT